MALTETPLQTLVFQLDEENTNLCLQIETEKAHFEATLCQLERSIVEFIVKAAKFRAKLDGMAVQMKGEAVTVTGDTMRELLQVRTRMEPSTHPGEMLRGIVIMMVVRKVRTRRWTRTRLSSGRVGLQSRGRQSSLSPSQVQRISPSPSPSQPSPSLPPPTHFAVQARSHFGSSQVG